MRDFKATGSYLEVGRQIGAAFKREIREYIALRYDQMSYELQEMRYCFQREMYQFYALELENYTKKCAPSEYQEMMGIAQATSQNISDIIFAIGYTDILDLILAQNAPLVDSGLHNECSTFLLKKETQVLCGQNWDMDIVSKNNACVMQKEYSDGCKLCGVTTVLGLVHMGMNDKGVSVGTANLSSKKASSDGLIFPIVLQNLLKTTNRTEALQMLNRIRFVAGHYYYAVYPQSPPLLIETDAKGYYEIELQDEIFVHTNHYVHKIPLKTAIHYSSDSIKRKAALEKCLQQKEELCEQTIMEVLADHEHGICRHSEREDGIVTAASIIFNPVEKRMYICDNAPCMGKWISYQMDSVF